MKHAVIIRLSCLILLSIFAMQINAAGLTEYLQNPETANVTATLPTDSTPASQADNITSITLKDSAQLKSIIELVVAGIVAAALIIVILVIFLGRWLASREKKLIKELRLEAEENSNQINSAASVMLEQEKETKRIAEDIKNRADDLSQQTQKAEKFSKEVVETSLHIKEYETQINEASSHVLENMNTVHRHWDNQVNETIGTINLFQHKLSENINIANEGLDKISEQKTLSSELLQDFLNQHNEQRSLIVNNSELSEKVAANLNQAFLESNKLLDMLKSQQDKAQLSLTEYSERLNNFEEQAYEQFDTSFQVADLARQELSANLEENRKHIETMRRQEEQSHGINTQISKNLETLDYSKIVKISETLDNTQDMFDEIHHKVEETRVMLEELKQIEEDIKVTASNVENVAKNHSILEDAAFINSSQENKASQDNTFFETEEIADKTINELIEATEDAIKAPKRKEDSSLASKIAENIKTPNKTVRENATVAISDYKLISGDSSTPLSFFRDIQKNSNKK